MCVYIRDGKGFKNGGGDMFILLFVSSPLRYALPTCSGDIRSGQCKGWESRNVEMAKIYSGEKLFLYMSLTKSIMYVCVTHCL